MPDTRKLCAQPDEYQQAVTLLVSEIMQGPMLDAAMDDISPHTTDWDTARLRIEAAAWDLAATIGDIMHRKIDDLEARAALEKEQLEEQAQP